MWIPSRERRIQNHTEFSLIAVSCQQFFVSMETWCWSFDKAWRRVFWCSWKLILCFFSPRLGERCVEIVFIYQPEHTHKKDTKLKQNETNPKNKSKLITRILFRTLSVWITGSPGGSVYNLYLCKLGQAGSALRIVQILQKIKKGMKEERRWGFLLRENLRRALVFCLPNIQSCFWQQLPPVFTQPHLFLPVSL